MKSILYTSQVSNLRGLAHLPHTRCERHFAEHVQLVHGGRGALVGLRHLNGGLAHHHCQHYHHQFGVDDFAYEAALPLKIECIGAALTVELLSKVPLEAQNKACICEKCI
jgi:hypothetical protein